MTIDLTPIFQAIIALLAALVTYKLIPWIKSKTTEQQQSNLYAAAKIAVYAAEQLFGAGQGEEKLQYALEALRRAGFDMDMPLVRETIENIVHGMIKPLSLAEILNDSEMPEEDQAADVMIHPPETETAE